MTEAEIESVTTSAAVILECLATVLGEFDDAEIRVVMTPVIRLLVGRSLGRRPTQSELQIITERLGEAAEADAATWHEPDEPEPDEPDEPVIPGYPDLWVQAASGKTTLHRVARVENQRLHVEENDVSRRPTSPSTFSVDRECIERGDVVACKTRWSGTLLVSKDRSGAPQ